MDGQVTHVTRGHALARKFRFHMLHTVLYNIDETVFLPVI